MTTAKKTDTVTIDSTKIDGAKADSKGGDPGDLSGIPIRVLIVDDDEAHAQAVAESLKRINCDCAVATSGAGGIALIEPIPPRTGRAAWTGCAREQRRTCGSLR